MNVASHTPRHPVDVNCFIGAYPFRCIPHPDPAVLVRVLEREGVGSAWVGHLPTVFHRQPSHGNRELYTALAPFRDRLSPAPVVRPDWPHWGRDLALAGDEGAAAIRAYPNHWGFPVGDGALLELGHACAEAGLPIVLTVRFEDLRQRSPLDVAGDLSAAAVRELVRRTPASVVVTCAGREMIEEVHWGLTPGEQRRVWWDISWLWGPPEDHLAHLVTSLGAERFIFGTGWPLRLTQAPAANLALLPPGLLPVRLADPRSLGAPHA